MEDWFSDKHMTEMIEKVKAELNDLVEGWFEDVIVPSIPVGPPKRAKGEGFKPGDLVRSAELRYYNEHPLYASWEVHIGVAPVDYERFVYHTGERGLEPFPGSAAVEELGNRLMAGDLDY